MNSIRISIKSVYGEDKIYPACEKAQAFADIAGTKTLTEQTLRGIRKLGYEIVIQSPAGLRIAA